MGAVDPPLALLAELTHRCPLQCPYCSNPLALDRTSDEMATQDWQRILDEAATLGVLQVHFSGGEPTVRRDLPQLVRHASARALYTNLITSGVLTSPERLAELAEAGLRHVQLSIQDVDPGLGDRIAGLPGAQDRKRRFAALVRQAGLPLTINAVVHRQNLHNLPRIIDLAQELAADRIEVAHVQYYGWALVNRDALLPSREQLDEASRVVADAATRLKGILAIDYVVPDYHAVRPKACMGGWGRQFLNVTPAGKVLPCHAAETLPGFVFPSARQASLADIWLHSDAFNRFRGTGWMPEPCRSCERREIDWGGCRCQAFALTGDAARADPVCALSPDHDVIDRARRHAAAASPPFTYRRIGAANGQAPARSPGPAGATAP